MNYSKDPIEQTIYKLLIIKNSQQFHKIIDHINNMSGWSIDYQTYFIIMKLLSILLPKNILELGYGYSTILFQQYAKFYKESHTVIENDENFIKYFNKLNNFSFNGKLLIKQLEIEKINKNTKILKYSNFRENLSNKYDFILIDGPKGSKVLSRPNILEIFDLLNKDFTIVIHDSNRLGEQNLIKKILENFSSCFIYNYDCCTIITTINLDKFDNSIKNMNKTNKIKIGIIGCGFVGGALKNWLEENNTDCELHISDPYKGYNDDVSDCDAYFIQIHVPTEEDGTQDFTTMKEIINKLPTDRPIWIRTTILPGSSKQLSEETGRIVYHMPEFLTERTYLEDFKWQPMVFAGAPEHREILKKIFIGKKYVEMTSEEAEMVKYAHNVFGALKVTYFNCIYDLCQKRGLDYAKVREGVLGSTYINDVHTQVPGPDGKLGYGGKCFPKDVNAFQHMFQNEPVGKLLAPLKAMNDKFRGV